MLLATSLLLAAAPLSSGQCPFDLRIEVTAAVASIPLTPAAPFDGIAVGDSTTMRLGFAADVACSTPSGLIGLLASADCSELVIDGASVAFDPSAEPCCWGESSNGSFVDTVDAEPTFLGGLRVRLVLNDPNGSVGVSAFDISQTAILIAAVTDPAFSVSMELVNDAGTTLVTFDVIELDGEPGFFGPGGYCGSNPNSTGFGSVLFASGSYAVSDNSLTLNAIALPQGSFMYFLVSQTQAMISSLPGSEGVLCLGGSIGRFVGPGEIQFSGSGTSTSLEIDLTNLPQPMGPVAVQPGETWNFTAWYRDTSSTGMATSNFTTGVAVTFQ